MSLKYPGNSEISFNPQSPAGTPHVGHTNADGSMLVIDGRPYLWREETGQYGWQEPGNPPGDWHWLQPLPFDYYAKVYAQASFMQPIVTEVGQTGA